MGEGASGSDLRWVWFAGFSLCQHQTDGTVDVHDERVELAGIRPLERDQRDVHRLHGQQLVPAAHVDAVVRDAQLELGRKRGEHIRHHARLLERRRHGAACAGVRDEGCGRPEQQERDEARGARQGREHVRGCVGLR